MNIRQLTFFYRSASTGSFLRGGARGGRDGPGGLQVHSRARGGARAGSSSFATAGASASRPSASVCSDRRARRSRASSRSAGSPRVLAGGAPGSRRPQGRPRGTALLQAWIHLRGRLPPHDARAQGEHAPLPRAGRPGARRPPDGAHRRPVHDRAARRARLRLRPDRHRDPGRLHGGATIPCATDGDSPSTTLPPTPCSGPTQSTASTTRSSSPVAGAGWRRRSPESRRTRESSTSWRIGTGSSWGVNLKALSIKPCRHDARPRPRRRPADPRVPGDARGGAPARRRSGSTSSAATSSRA